MSHRLSQAERNAIIYDFINGVANEEYEVKKTKTGKYQVRKRKSPFVPVAEPIQTPEPIQETTQQQEAESEAVDINKINRISNEELLSKLSSLLELKSQNSDDESEDEYMRGSAANVSLLDTAPSIVPVPQPVQQQVQQSAQQYQAPRHCRKRLSLI